MQGVDNSAMANPNSSPPSLPQIQDLITHPKSRTPPNPKCDQNPHISLEGFGVPDFQALNLSWRHKLQSANIFRQ